MKRQSHQRITKIKRDKIEELLKQAELISVEDGTVVQPQGADLIPYPDMDRLRLWTNSYLLPGVNKIYPTRIDNQGTMYLTAIVDGLPLHTKMTKTIEGTSTETIVTGKQLNSSILTTYGSPTFNETTGVVSGFSSSNYFILKPEYVVPGTEFCLCIIAGDTSDTTYRNIDFSYSMLQIAQQGSSIKTWKDTSPSGEKIIVSNITTGQVIYIKSQYIDSTHITIKYSFDGVEYTTVYENYEDARNWGSQQYGTLYSIGIGSVYLVNPFLGSIDFSKSYVRLSSGLPEYLATDTTETITFTSETSKPGLWLSNFIYPVYGDGHGSYLEHNKVHSNEGSFANFNSDIRGNYSYSFIQRAKITKHSEANWDDGCDTTYWQSTPDNYNIHYSPNIHSCMAYPSLQISNPKFGQIYVTYQSIVTPSDPDMQKYQESDSKCVSFDNRSYSNSESVTNYAAKLVGKDWSYELTFNGNGSGSGNDYGNGGNPDNDNGSNGGCVTGTITYVDSILGTTCTQEINSCFQTIQSYFNPDVPDLDVPPLQDDSIETIPHPNNNISISCRRPYDREMTIDRPFIGGKFYTSNQGDCYGDNKSSAKFTVTFSDGSTITNSSCNRCGPAGSDPGEAGCAFTWKFTGPSDTTLVKVTGSPANNNWCDGRADQLWVTVGPREQQNVNIYMNIYDLKAEAEDQGLPWTGGCGEARFTVEFSTSKCDRPGCTSRLIASNVDINSLGDISRLNNITITG